MNYHEVTVEETKDKFVETYKFPKETMIFINDFVIWASKIEFESYVIYSESLKKDYNFPTIKIFNTGNNTLLTDFLIAVFSGDGAVNAIKNFKYRYTNVNKDYMIHKIPSQRIVKLFKSYE